MRVAGKLCYLENSSQGFKYGVDVQESEASTLKMNEPGKQKKTSGKDVIAHNQRVYGGLEKSNALSRDGFGKGNHRCPF